MNFIGTRLHGFLDYAVSIFLIASPWIFGFATWEAETWVPLILGGFSLLYSLITDYEYGLVKTISMRWHLGLDFLSAMILTFSPWIFNFEERVYLPHLWTGIAEMTIVLISSAVPYRSADIPPAGN